MKSNPKGSSTYDKRGRLAEQSRAQRHRDTEKYKKEAKKYNSLPKEKK